MITEMCVSIANYIIKQTSAINSKKTFSEQIPMTSKRLQKLLYFCDIEYMKKHDGQSMFEDEFYAWPSGPVIPSVYYKFMKFQNGVMQPVDYNDNLDEDVKHTIDTILAQTENMDTLDLVDYSHVDGGPWAHSYQSDDIDHNQIISKSAIYKFYKERDIFSI